MSSYSGEELFPQANTRSMAGYTDNPLSDEEFMTIVDEGRRRLGGIAHSFENCIKQWASSRKAGSRCPVCARWEDERCMEEC